MKFASYILPACIVVASAIGGYFLVRPHNTKADDVAEKVAKGSGEDVSLLKEAMPIYGKASTMKSPDLTEAELAVLWKVVDTKNPKALPPVFMAVSDGCPASKADECYTHLEPLAQSFPDEDVQIRAYETLWDLKPQNRNKLREFAKQSVFPRIRKEVPLWPDELSPTNH